MVVSESGASIYSASETAVAEYPDLDVTVRGAISIAHRLQDPLAELVKIDPKSIGVGQYQHDVNQTLLRKCLDREVESCVNLVGVDVNMASIHCCLMWRASGQSWPSGSSSTATPTVHSRTEKNSVRFPSWVRRRFSKRLDFFAFAKALSRWTIPPYIRKAISSEKDGRSSAVAAATGGQLVALRQAERPRNSSMIKSDFRRSRTF